MHRKHTKPQAERAVKKSVSMPMSMFVQASRIQQHDMLPSFSDFVQGLIRTRLQARDPQH